MVSFTRLSGQATTAVILALAEQPATWRYGHELCQQLDLEPGRLYRALMRLADLGLLEAAWESDWLLPDRHARRFGVGMAVALVAGFVLTTSRQELGDPPGSEGMVFYLLIGPLLVVLPGSAAAAAVGRSFRSGLWACAWAIVLGAPLLITAWLAEALVWYQQGQGTVLDGAGGLGVGVNLGDAVWWPLVFLALWAVPLGVVGAAAGSARARRSRLDDLNGAPAARCPDASTPPSLRNGRCQR
jgi:PadR family transcriptional regulator, regulatory protein PadR